MPGTGPESLMLAALSVAWPELPEDLRRFDALARADPGGRGPSFEEYSARISVQPGAETGRVLSPFRQTCYFDVGADPSLVAVANARFSALAEALEFGVAPELFTALDAGAVAGPDVLQIVLGLDAAADRTRLKYYLIFQADSHATVERLRVALGAPALPTSLRPGSVYILGLDFDRARRGQGGLSDFKLYVRLDAGGVPRVIRNLRSFEALWRGSRYVVFQHCLNSGGRQVYFHASSAQLLEAWLGDASRREPTVAEFAGRMARANAALAAKGQASLRPWIVSFPWAEGVLQPGPSNLYFHF